MKVYEGSGGSEICQRGASSKEEVDKILNSNVANIDDLQ